MSLDGNWWEYRSDSPPFLFVESIGSGPPRLSYPA